MNIKSLSDEKKLLLAIIAGFMLIIGLIGFGYYRLCLLIGETQQKVQVIQSHTQYVPMPSDTVVVQLPGRVDTATVIRDYYQKIVYHDTLVNNDTVKFFLTDTVYKNGIASRELDYTIKVPQVKVKHHGIGADFIGDRYSLMLMGEYQYNRMKIMAGYDFYNKCPSVGIGVKLLEY